MRLGQTNLYTIRLYDGGDDFQLPEQDSPLLRLYMYADFIRLGRFTTARSAFILSLLYERLYG